MSAPTSTASAVAAASTTPAAVQIPIVTKAQVVSIATWILLVTSTLAMFARLSTKWAVSRRLQLDDGFAILALICHVCSGVAVTILDNNGLGEDISNLSDAEKQVFAQSAFAADMLFIGTSCFAKLSIVLLFNHITRQKMHRLLSYGCAGFIGTWSAASLIGAAFLCEAPATWNLFGKCYHPATFWYIFNVINAITDAALIVIPTFIIVPLHMSRSKKAMIISCFGTRICDIGATIALIAFTATFSDPNFTKSLWPWMLASQFAQCIGIITSCIPYLKPLLESFPSGMFMSDEIRRKGTNAEISADGYIRTPEPSLALRPVESLKSGSEPRSFSRQSGREPTVSISGTRPMRVEHYHHYHDHHYHLDRRPLQQSRPSASADEMGIVKTTTIVTTN